MKPSKGAKPTNSDSFDMDEKLINDVISQIQSDVEVQDLSALEELLRGILNAKTKKYYVSYLTEERATDAGYDMNELYEDDDE